jgi:hypothetical protein
LTLPAYGFSEERRSDLARLGLADAQIIELEGVLATCKLRIADSPPLQDVRDKLLQIRKDISKLNKSIASLIWHKESAASREGLIRLQEAAYKRRDILGPITDTMPIPGLNILDALASSVDDAIMNLGRQQRRSRAANPEPVWLIAQALESGWGKQNRGKPIPTYEMPSAKFAEIVQIVYETVGAPSDYVSERALRGYRKWRKLEAAKKRVERDRIGTPDPEEI